MLTELFQVDRAIVQSCNRRNAPTFFFYGDCVNTKSLLVLYVCILEVVLTFIPLYLNSIIYFCLV